MLLPDRLVCVILVVILLPVSMPRIRSFYARTLAGLLCTAFCAFAAPLSAQALPGDSIVKLAVDASRGGGAPTVVLLDALDASIEPDGTGRRTFRAVVQVLQQSAVAPVAERRFTWQPSRQDLTVDWVRVLRPDGTVISSAPTTDQSGDMTPSMQNPIYVDSRTRRMSLAGVAVNTIVDVQYTVTDRAPWRAGDFLISWTFSPPIALRTSYLRLSVPADFTPEIDEKNLTFRRSERAQNGRRIYEWRADAPQVVRAEPFAADSDGVRMSVVVSPAHSWDSVAAWYNGLARSRYSLDAISSARADSVVRGARSRIDTLRALHRWIAQDIRYVSVSLGLGGYQPRTPAEVLSTGYGDCKDKTTLFVAAARRWGIDARPVLLHLNGTHALKPVSIARFNHAIAAVADAKGSYTYTDLTASTIPYGEIPLSYRGSFGVVVLPNGTSESVQFPLRSADSSGQVLRLRGELASNGRMRMYVDDLPLGDNAWAMRAAFATPLDSGRRAAGMRSLSTTYLPEARADSLVVFSGLDFSQQARLRAVLLDGRGARQAGPVWLLHMPTAIRQFAATAANTAREIESLPRRKLPIDAKRVIGLHTTDVEYRVTLPEGWSAQLPTPVTATSFFARYESTYRMDGRDLVMRRVLRGTGSGVHPPERIAEVVAWMRAVAVDDHEYITLTPGAAR